MPLRVPEHVTWKSIKGGVVLLDLKSSHYYTLNKTASDVWRVILDGGDTDDIVAAIQAKYDCSRDVCLPDVTEVLTFLKKEALLEETPPD